MKLSSRVVLVGCGLAAALTVAGCTSGSDGSSSPSAIATVTTTAPPTVTGAPVTGTPTATTSGGSGSGSGGAAGSGGSGGNGSGPVVCTPTVMTFRLGSSSGAAGTQYVTVIARNASSSDCVTTGYPGLALLDSAGKQYAQAVRDTSAPVTTIVVSPGQEIASVVGFSDVPSGGAGQCPTTTSFLFTLPDNTDSTTLQHTGQNCGATVQPFARYTGS